MSTDGGADVQVEWEQARDANRALWDDRAALHEVAYNVTEFVDDPALVSQIVADDRLVLERHLGGPLAGRRVVHLQCHIGTDTISLARCGARMTGLDFSGESLAAARRLAEATHTDVEWVQSDVLEARAALEGDFEVVYTSIGVLCWLADLDAWAQQVAQLLQPGGIFFVRDGHPMLYALDESAPDQRITLRYFANGAAQTWDDGFTYAGDGVTKHTRSYEWPHAISEVLGALLRAGLVVEAFDEGKVLPWQFSPVMVPTPEGYVWPGELADRVPCTFTVVARKPR